MEKFDELNQDIGYERGRCVTVKDRVLKTERR